MNTFIEYLRYIVSPHVDEVARNRLDNIIVGIDAGNTRKTHNKLYFIMSFKRKYFV